jgi:hypothetical protein
MGASIDTVTRVDQRAADLLLPPATRLIHIGPHKTGSTAVQVAFAAARSELESYGVHYPGRGQRPRQAGWSIGLPGKAGLPRPPESHWDALVADVAGAGDARVCISNEDFGRAGPRQRARIVADLGGDRAHVVAVARRLDSYLPSQWQERVKAGVTLSWEAWLEIVLEEEPTRNHYERTNVWRAHDVGGLLSRWQEVVAPEQITLIVSDDSDRELLPRTFERLLGLPNGLLKPHPDRSNRSLRWAEVEVVRAAHGAFAAAGVSRRARDPWMFAGVLPALREADLPRSGPATPPFPEWAIDHVRRLGEERAEAVRASGVRVVGTADTLLSSPTTPVGDPGVLPPADQALVAVVTGALVAATVGQVPGLVAEQEEAGSEAEDDGSDPPGQ